MPAPPPPSVTASGERAGEITSSGCNPHGEHPAPVREEMPWPRIMQIWTGRPSTTQNHPVAAMMRVHPLGGPRRSRQLRPADTHRRRHLTDLVRTGVRRAGRAGTKVRPRRLRIFGRDQARPLPGRSWHGRTDDEDTGSCAGSRVFAVRWRWHSGAVGLGFRRFARLAVRCQQTKAVAVAPAVPTPWLPGDVCQGLWGPRQRRPA